MWLVPSRRISDWSALWFILRFQSKLSKKTPADAAKRMWAVPRRGAITEGVLFCSAGRSIANQCHGLLSDMPVDKLTNPMQLVIQFTVGFCGCLRAPPPRLSVFQSCFFHYLFFFSVYLLWSWLFISASHVMLCVFVCVSFAPVVSVYTQTSIYLCASVCARTCVCVRGDCSCFTVGRVD